jgi:hypothetical protein
MSDRVSTLTIVLDQPMRDSDDLQAVINAIGMVKGVAAVEKGPVANLEDYTWQIQKGTSVYRDVMDLLAEKLMGVKRKDS